MNTPESMQQLEELFHEAVGLEPPERADFMARVRNQIRNWQPRSSLSLPRTNSRTV